MVEAIPMPMPDAERARYWHQKFLDKEKENKHLVEDRNKEFRELMKKKEELSEAIKYLLLCLCNASSPVPYDVNDAPLYYQWLRVSQAENLEKTNHIDALKKETDEWRSFWAYKKNEKNEEFKKKDEELATVKKKLKAKEDEHTNLLYILTQSNVQTQGASQTPLGRTPLANPKSLTNSSNLPAAFVPKDVPAASSPYAPGKGGITQPAYGAMAPKPLAPRAGPYSN